MSPRLEHLLTVWSAPFPWESLAKADEQHRQATEYAHDVRAGLPRLTARSEQQRELVSQADAAAEVYRQEVCRMGSEVGELWRLIRAEAPALLAHFPPVHLPDSYTPRQRAEMAHQVLAGILTAERSTETGSNEGAVAVRSVAEAQARSGAAHAPNFEWVDWFGTVYEFAGAERVVVGALWECWECGRPGLARRTLLDVAGSESDRLRDVFRQNGQMNAAWVKMIGKVDGSKDLFSLIPPGDRQSPAEARKPQA